MCTRAVLLVVLLASTTVSANGRARLTNGVAFQPNAPASIYVRTTFGSANGTIFATTFNGLRVSRDGACSFTTATAELPMDAPNRIADTWIDALDLAPNGEVWVGSGANWDPDFKAVARSLDGSSWDKVFRFVELSGPLDCRAPDGPPEPPKTGGWLREWIQRAGGRGWSDAASRRVAVSSPPSLVQRRR
jgi:hypothetical protein